MDCTRYQLIINKYYLFTLITEALQRGIFSTQSDVWSFGILLWELFTYGMVNTLHLNQLLNSILLQIPYSQFSNSEAVEKVYSGYRMTPPDNCPDEIAKLMQQTWNESPSSRPSFKVQHHQNL
jgi:serine/threonine protein kinase